MWGEIVKLFDNERKKLEYCIIKNKKYFFTFTSTDSDVMISLDDKLDNNIGYIRINWINDKDCASVFMFVVKPEFRRNRIATKLFEKAVQELKNNTLIKCISVIPNSTSSDTDVILTDGELYSFYKSLGFENISNNSKKMVYYLEKQ